MVKPEKRNIALIGMPAAGKTTIGHLLAPKMGYGFIDTDVLIEQGEKRTLSQIIAANGIDAFLDKEAQYLLKLSCEKKVIATGGSVVYKKRAMEHLLHTSIVIYLEIGLTELKTRLSDLEKRGVAIGPDQDIKDLYVERIRLYDQFHDFKVQCDALTPHEVIGVIEDQLNQYQDISGET